MLKLALHNLYWLRPTSLTVSTTDYFHSSCKYPKCNIYIYIYIYCIKKTHFYFFLAMFGAARIAKGLTIWLSATGTEQIRTFNIKARPLHHQLCQPISVHKESVTSIGIRWCPLESSVTVRIEFFSTTDNHFQLYVLL